LHARNEERKKAIMVENPGATQVIVGNSSNLEETKNLARQANKVGPFDVVIH
jgi:dihydrodipicolinate synthase/N-acetylneuraminate lyase